LLKVPGKEEARLDGARECDGEVIRDAMNLLDTIEFAHKLVGGRINERDSNVGKQHAPGWKAWHCDRPSHAVQVTFGPTAVWIGSLGSDGG
jgi:hypothetical protein